MLQAGLQHTISLTVDESMTAAAVGSGGLHVLSTPSMIALMERCARDAAAPHLEANEGTVGTLVNIRHLSATPVGMEVRCECLLTKIEGRTLCFEVRAFDASGCIGEGVHERAVIDNERFMRKAMAKG